MFILVPNQTGCILQAEKPAVYYSAAFGYNTEKQPFSLCSFEFRNLLNNLVAFYRQAPSGVSPRTIWQKYSGKGLVIEICKRNS